MFVPSEFICDCLGRTNFTEVTKLLCNVDLSLLKDEGSASQRGQSFPCNGNETRLCFAAPKREVRSADPREHPPYGHVLDEHGR